MKVLQKLVSRLKDRDINWVITGSTSFALQGMSVEPKDIDIQTDKNGAYVIERLFSEFVAKKVSFSSTDKIRSHFGELNIGRTKVEIMGDVQKRLEDSTWENPVDLSRHKQFVEVEGIQLPVLPLEYEYGTYIKLARHERAEMIKKFLRARK